MVIPWPYTTLRCEVECIAFEGFTILIRTALVLFALIRLDLHKVTMFLSLDEQILKLEEAFLFILLL